MFEIVEIFQVVGDLSPTQKGKNRVIDQVLTELRAFLLKPEIIRNAGWICTSKPTQACANYVMRWDHIVEEICELEEDETDCSYELWLSRRPSVEKGKGTMYSMSVVFRNPHTPLIDLELTFSFEEEMTVYEDFKGGGNGGGNHFFCSALVLLFLDIEEWVHFETEKLRS
jgi:hypothetical protein